MKKPITRQERKKRIRRAQTRAVKKLEELKATYPDLWRRCGNDYCCQALTRDGYQCSRPSMLGKKTYIKELNCCMLCWQHASQVGLYGLYKGIQFMYERKMSWDEYCNYNPEYCENILK